MHVYFLLPSMKKNTCSYELLQLKLAILQENPIFFHMTDASPDKVRSILDQMSEVGFEMMIYSFGSGFDIESTNDTYIKEIRDIVSYAHR